MTLTADYVTDDDVAISFDDLLGGVGRIANLRILPGGEVLTWRVRSHVVRAPGGAGPRARR